MIWGFSVRREMAKGLMIDGILEGHYKIALETGAREVLMLSEVWNQWRALLLTHTQAVSFNL